VGCDGSPLSIRRISVAVKSILGAIDLPWNDPLWADAPINTAEFPYLYTSVSNSVFEFSLRSPDLSASRIAACRSEIRFHPCPRMYLRGSRRESPCPP